jgi:predicted ATPase/signal transduction histidine kinase
MDAIAQLQGYSLTEKLYEGPRTMVFRGLCEDDQKPVVVKFLKDEFPSFDELMQFNHQYNIAKDLNLPTVARPLTLIPYGNASALVVEDFGGYSLKQFLQERAAQEAVNCTTEGCAESVEETGSETADGTGDETVDECLGNSVSGLILFFTIAIQVAEALEGLSDAGVIHKDIKPANIIIHPESHQIKLIDFSIASWLPRESQDVQHPGSLEGTLSYLSPEQTGRMNRGVDYRSDFYAFGVTCYELLSGQLPFVSDDPMEIVHGHLAKQPMSLFEISEGKIPALLSDIVIKLMAKNAEDRYQSAFGIKHDLLCGLEMLKETGQIEAFELGQKDISDRFLLPEKLYGRQREIAHLLAAFERVSQGTTELMLMAGSSGIGKTAVVNEVHKPIARQRGYFVKSKCDQLQRDVPLFAFIQAFRRLIRLLLSESDEQLLHWRSQIFEAVGRNGRVLTAVIPELERIIGLQPPVPELGAQAAENRFYLLMQKFVRVFTQPQHPLVIFLDDLQWADRASLKLLELLMRDDGHLLIIGAYRDNEVSSSHPLMLTLEEIRMARASRVQPGSGVSGETVDETVGKAVDETVKDGLQASSLVEFETADLTCELDGSGLADSLDGQAEAGNQAHINVLTLTPLTQEDVVHFVAEALHSTAAIARPLAELTFQKTGGNPFFCTQFLTALQAENKIVFDPVGRRWQYDLAQVEATLLADDVVSLVAQRLQKLPEATQLALQMAACIGAQFDLATLAIAAQQPVLVLAENLLCALQEGLIVPTSDRYKAVGLPGAGGLSAGGLSAGDIDESAANHLAYRFSHDRIQQAAYGLIDPERQAVTHRAIGQRLLANCTATQKERSLFDIVNHLNKGLGLIEGEAERMALVELNLAASQRAKAATAYEAAFNYLQTAVKLLPADSWQAHYELTLTLYNEAAEAAHLSGKLVVMQRYIDAVLQQGRTLLDKIHAYETQIQAVIGQNYLLQSVEMALTLLAELGVEIPRSPQPEQVMGALQETAKQLERQPIASLIDLPEMEDPQSLVIVRLLTKAVSAAYIAQPEVLPLLVCTGINRCLALGNSPLSAFLYAWYGVMLCEATEKIADGYEMGELALNLLEKIPAKEIQARVVSLVYFLIYPWKAPIQSSLTPLKEIYQGALEHGDSEYAAWAIAAHCHYEYLAGCGLEKLSGKIARYSNSVKKLEQEAALTHLNIFQQVTLNLLGQSNSPVRLNGEAYSEAAMMPIQLAANDLTGLAYLHLQKGLLAYLFYQPHEAQACFNRVREYALGIRSSQWLPALMFYDSLACLAVAAADLLPRVVNNQEQLRAWARLAPANHLHRWHLVEAERCRLNSQKAAAIDHYDQAIALAQAHGFIQEQALAQELAAQFYLLWDKGRLAQSYMLDAYYAYSRWGAAAKITNLEKRYPRLLEAALQKKLQTLSSTDTILAYANNRQTTSTSSISEVIDLTTLLQTSQVLSGEIELEKLLAALLEAVIQNAGADKCALLMPRAATVMPQDEGLGEAPILEGESLEIGEIGPLETGSVEIGSLETRQAEYEISAQAEEGEWVIEALSGVNQPPIILQGQSIKPGEVLPVSLINQVRRTHEPVVIFNAAVHSLLTVDPYVLKHQPKSVLCAPIIHQRKLIAILYLENNLTIGAFTSRRVEVLNLICTQAAISLENARLYHRTQQALADLQHSHIQLVQSEKMSALGSLVAGVAHEINNPVNFLRGNLKPALNYVQDLLDVLDMVVADEPREEILEELEDINLEFVREDLPNLLHSMTFGISRISDISTSLRTFSRADKDYKTAFNLHEGLDSTLLILKHRLQSADSMAAIQVVKQYGAIPEIQCFAGQLNQVFMNLIANAIDAIGEARQDLAARLSPEAIAAHMTENPSQITISTRLLDEETVEIAIADNGPGMDEAVQARVFEHLFTTKPVGKGTGLGLSISAAIVNEKHGGKLSVRSAVGQGTTFLIALPVG